MKKLAALATAIAVSGMFVGSAYAIVVTPDTSAESLAAMLVGGSPGISLTGFSLSGNGAGLTASSGTYTNLSGTYGMPDGIVLSSGQVADYSDGPNTVDFNRLDGFDTTATAAQTTLLESISGPAENGYFDVTEFTIRFDLADGDTDIFFLAAWGSEEFPEFVDFTDPFGVFLNGTNLAIVGGLPINVAHPDMAAVPGTELDGMMNPGGLTAMLFGGTGVVGSNTLTFIIADKEDTVYDSTVYIANLSTGGANPIGVPESASTIALLGCAFVALAGIRRRARA